MREIRDEALAARAAKGDLDAFEELVNRHRAAVYQMARAVTGSHADADDAAQETFIRAYRSLGSYDSRRPFRPWLRKITYNTSLNILRTATNRARRFLPGEALQPPDPSPNPEEEVESRESRRGIEAAVKSLSFELRTTLHLRAAEGLSYQDIARVTGVRIGTVMSRLSRAREKVLGSLQAAEGLPEGGEGT
ncbi:MAG: RNA polymerase sigma factor [Deltaproteobacteria bacterium]|nr:RNA polymerase sigma factor [Deltaproteobacteria bacterium]